MQIITSLVSGLTLGSTILVGKYTGMEDKKRIQQSIATTFTVFSLAAVLLTVLMLLFERQLLTLLNTPEEAFAYTMKYVAICAWGNFFICGYNSLSAILRGYGDSRHPLYFVGIACVVNIILDFILVRHLGVSGTGKPERARKSLWYGMGFALGVAFLFWLWAQISPRTMIGIFSDDADIIAAGIPFFHACSYDYLLAAVVFCLNGYLNGRSKTLWRMSSGKEKRKTKGPVPDKAMQRQRI